MNRWCDYKSTFTVVDLCTSGACYEGVVEAVVNHGGAIIAQTKKHHRNEYVQRATAAIGYGDGYGSGYGYGYGYGSGDGYGYGDGITN